MDRIPLTEEQRKHLLAAHEHIRDALAEFFPLLQPRGMNPPGTQERALADAIAETLNRTSAGPTVVDVIEVLWERWSSFLEEGIPLHEPDPLPNRHLALARDAALSFADALDHVTFLAGGAETTDLRNVYQSLVVETNRLLDRHHVPGPRLH